MRTNEWLFALVILVVMGCILAFLWAYNDSVNDEREDYYNPMSSPDYIGGGMYACPQCNWTGYVGLMVFHDGGLLWADDYYCPICGYDIDVRGE